MNRMKIATLAFGAAILGGAGFLLNGLPTVAQASDMTVYKSDSCGCCGGWVEHMRKAGYAPERYDVMRFGTGQPARFMTFEGANPVRR